MSLTGVMVFIAYFGGLFMKLVSYIVDAGFLVCGFNPHFFVWDELISIVAVTPVLYFLYHNSWLTIVSGAAAGLGSGLLTKWLIFRRERRKSATSPSPARATVGVGSEDGMIW
jgi:hypothetical protein